MNWELAEAVSDTGRVEIINNARTYQYAKAMGIKGISKPCCSMVEVLACDSGPYTCDVTINGCNILQEDVDQIQCSNRSIIPVYPGSYGAPWWSDGEIGSYDFAGFYSLSITGWDSTYSRETNSNALDGLTFGPSRREGRSLTIDGLLLASSEAGLEFGMSYYDSLISNLGSCGLFSLYFPVACPDEDFTDADSNSYLRHLRRVSLVAGITTVETHLANGEYVARIQFTIASESPWIFKEPIFALDDEMFDPETCACDNREIINEADQVPPIYGTRSILTTRKRYPIKIARDGSICRIGDWPWSETQLGGGTGVVVLDSYVESDEIDLEAIEAATTASTTDLAAKSCPNCDVVLYWDVDGTDPKHMTFENLRWSNTTGGVPPCTCDLNIVGYYVRNDSYDSGQPIKAGSNVPWSFVAANGTDEDCCYLDLQYTTKNSGTWQPTGAAMKQPWASGIGRDPYTLTQLFPPVGCGLKVMQRCEDKEFELQPYLNSLITTDYRTISVVGPVKYFKDGGWESADGQSGCLPESFCANGVLATVPQVDEGPDVELSYFNSPFTKEKAYVGVKGPVKYNEDGSWISFDGVEGCLPTGTCVSAEKYIPYITNSSEIGTCVTTTECPIKLDVVNDLWMPDGWFFDPVVAFPADGCNYYIADTQDLEKVLVEEQYLVSGGTCGFTDTTGLTQIFPSFATSAWERVLVPTLTPPPRTTAFCSPFERMQKCGVFTNPSGFYKAAGNIEIKIGSKDLKNFRIRAWLSPFDSLPTPCDDFSFWLNVKPDFTLEVPHLPSGGTLYIDGELRQGSLNFPGGSSEPAIRYVSGADGLPYRNFILGPCETVYYLAEASCADTAENLTLTISFSNFYGASGTLVAV